MTAPDEYWATKVPNRVHDRDVAFWDLVDSQRLSGLHLHTEYCTDEYRCDHPEHTSWLATRPGCLALSSRGERCSQLTDGQFPFCYRYHARPAVDAFVKYLAGSLKQHRAPAMEIASLAIALLDACSASDADRCQVADRIDPSALTEIETVPEPLTRPAEKTALYRHFDADNVLLYVGIASDPTMRFRSHARQSPWMDFANRHEGEWFATREEAAAAERVAIREEAPLFNKVHAGPDRDARVKRYLIEHEAWDHLAVAS